MRYSCTNLSDNAGEATSHAAKTISFASEATSYATKTISFASEATSYGSEATSHATEATSYATEATSYAIEATSHGFWVTPLFGTNNIADPPPPLSVYLSEKRF